MKPAAAATLALLLGPGCVNLVEPDVLGRKPAEDALAASPAMDTAPAPAAAADAPAAAADAPPAAADAPAAAIVDAPPGSAADVASDRLGVAAEVAPEAMVPLVVPETPADGPQAAMPDAGADAVADGGTDARTCTPLQSWATAFRSDPTRQDLNGDSLPDFVVRGGGSFDTSTISGGLWRARDGVSLDTNPSHAFDRRTVATVRLRSLGVPTGRFGGMFWINVDQTALRFGAVFFSLQRTAGGSQTFDLYGKPDDSTHQRLASVSGLPDALVTVTLDIDPRASTVDLWVEALHRGRFAFPRTGSPRDPFATLYAWPGSGGVEYGAVSVEVCAP